VPVPATSNHRLRTHLIPRPLLPRALSPLACSPARTRSCTASLLGQEVRDRKLRARRAVGRTAQSNPDGGASHRHPRTRTHSHVPLPRLTPSSSSPCAALSPSLPSQLAVGARRLRRSCHRRHRCAARPCLPRRPKTPSSWAVPRRPRVSRDQATEPAPRRPPLQPPLPLPMRLRRASVGKKRGMGGWR